MRPKGTAAELEVRRRIAGQLLLEGKGVSEVARLVKVSRSAASQWKRTLNEGGLDALKAKPHPGPQPCLKRQQQERLVKLLHRGAVEAGYSTDLWTCGRVAEVIHRQFAVRYHPAHVWRLLRQLGWTPQKPEQRARERDEAAIAHWRAGVWPRLKKRS